MRGSSRDWLPASITIEGGEGEKVYIGMQEANHVTITPYFLPTTILDLKSHALVRQAISYNRVAYDRPSIKMDIAESVVVPSEFRAAIPVGVVTIHLFLDLLHQYRNAFRSSYFFRWPSSITSIFSTFKILSFKG